VSRVFECDKILQQEWRASQEWANLSCFDRVNEDKLLPAATAANVLYDKLSAALREETARLESLHKVQEDAEHLNTLIQIQARNQVQSL
jgi:hypothetical protein